jgi:DNA-binding NarL/FixJ family response regulator
MKRIDQVAELLAEGFALTDIATELGITRDAVKSAFKKIKARLGGQAR